MTRLLTLSLLLSACGTAPPEHGHDHDHDHGDAHAHDASGGHGVVTMPLEPVSLGSWTATLHPEAESLRVTATDASGAAVVPAGELRVVLTGVGEAEQRVVLAAGADGWSGTARAAGAVWA